MDFIQQQLRTGAAISQLLVDTSLADPRTKKAPKRSSGQTAEAAVTSGEGEHANAVSETGHTPRGTSISRTSPGSSAPESSAYLHALQQQLCSLVDAENAALRTRMKVILRNCEAESQQLSNYHDEIFLAELDRWLGLRVAGESAALDRLDTSIRNAIEQAKSIDHALVIAGENALVDEDIAVNLTAKNTLSDETESGADAIAQS